MGSSFITKLLKHKIIGKLVVLLIIINVGIELSTIITRSVVFLPLWYPVDYILKTDRNPHSLYSVNKHDTPLYTLTHDSNLKLLFPKMGPHFVREIDSDVP